MSGLKLVLLSLALCLFLFSELSFAQSNVPFPQSVIRYMASRQMRYHHFLWHQVRDNYERFSESTKRAFRNLGWQPPNPSRDSRGNRITNNYAGEDFLYMHRQMIATANQIISDNRERYGRITGWTTIPAPGDRTYPVPPPYQRGSTSNNGANYKTDAYYYDRLTRYERNLKDASRLRRMTLNELGLEIESGVHNVMHNRWAGPSSVGYRGGGNINNGVPTISKQWDDPRYDWLVDTYSSHVNPVFWKLHGWIDDRVEDWRRANGLSSIRWRGTWTGGPMSNLGSALRKEGQDSMADMNEGVSDLMEEALQLFLKSGLPETSPADEVEPPSKLKKAKKIRKCKTKRRSV